MKTSSFTEITPFRSALAAGIRFTVRNLKSDGITAMGTKNLMQMVSSPSAALDGAPRGTNTGYLYAEMFKDVAGEVAPGFLLE